MKRSDNVCETNRSAVPACLRFTLHFDWCTMFKAVTKHRSFIVDTNGFLLFFFCMHIIYNLLKLRDDLQTKNLTFKSIQNLRHVIVKLLFF